MASSLFAVVCKHFSKRQTLGQILAVVVESIYGVLAWCPRGIELRNITKNLLIREIEVARFHGEFS